VLKFSLGFGYKLAGKKIGETEYLISTIPLGGYVKMLGENDDEMESVSPGETEKAFNNQHVLKRIAIVAAGPLFNLILAYVLFCGLYIISGSQIMTAEIGQVRSNSPADTAGINKGDIITAVQDKPVKSWGEIKELIQGQQGKPLLITVQRSNEILTMTVIPEEAVVKNIFGEDVKSALIGIVASGKYQKIELGLWQAIKEAFLKTYELTGLTFLTVIKLLQGVVSIKTLGGPLMIGQMTGQLAQESFSYLIPLLAVISINLGILNLLPIPILDGGVIIFLLIELVMGKPISIKKRDLAQKVGLFMLGLLILVVTINDLSRIEFFRKLFEMLFG